MKKLVLVFVLIFLICLTVTSIKVAQYYHLFPEDQNIQKEDKDDIVDIDEDNSIVELSVSDYLQEQRNVNDGGFVGYDDGYYFYFDEYGDLISEKEKTGETQVILQLDSDRNLPPGIVQWEDYNLIIRGNWIYYLNYSYEPNSIGDSEQVSASIARVKKDGSKTEILQNCKAFWFTIFEDKIYYLKYPAKNEVASCLWSASIDGMEPKMLRDFSKESLIEGVSANRLYYRDGKIYMVFPDEMGSKVCTYDINKDDFKSFTDTDFPLINNMILSDNLLCLSFQWDPWYSEERFYRYDGTELTDLLIDDETITLKNYYKDHLIFETYSEENGTVLEMADSDLSNRKVLVEREFSGYDLNIVNNTLFLREDLSNRIVLENMK